MRISKDPEVRKQEIINTAMGIFSEKGFEAVNMKDIAQAVGVAAGLCYHIFLINRRSTKQLSASMQKFAAVVLSRYFSRQTCPSKLV